MVYSPMDAFEYAREHKEEQVVFLSVGFETTTPASCLSVKMAKEDFVGKDALIARGEPKRKRIGLKVCQELMKC